MAPVPRPIPRFIASSSKEALPYGRWAQLLRDEFARACEQIGDLPADAPPPDRVIWFPERSWGNRTYIPATAQAGEGEATIEYFGHVSFERPPDGDAGDFRAVADFTDVLAEQNPDWAIDLNDDVIGPWRGESAREGDVTLIWGTPLVPGATAASAELDREVADQVPVTEDRFTLLALDAIKGFGDDIYVEVRLWNQKNAELASESLYEAGDEDEAGEGAGAEDERDEAADGAANQTADGGDDEKARASDGSR